MATKTLPDVGLLRQLLDYDPETGVLTWRERTPDMFCGSARRREWQCNAWNGKFAGKEAFTAKTHWGHRRGRLGGVDVRAHRVAWAVFYGEWPEFEIDHINGIPDDNRLSNLRLATSSENKWNRGARKNTASKYLGVVKSRKKWVAQLFHNGEYYYLGTHDSEDLAAVAVNKALVCLRGKFARLNVIKKTS